MAICEYCGLEMLDKAIVTCTANTRVVFGDGKKMPSLPYTRDDRPADHRCHDCGIALGGKHHPGCDIEECPRCHGQLLSCNCDVTDEL